MATIIIHVHVVVVFVKVVATGLLICISSQFHCVHSTRSMLYASGNIISKILNAQTHTNKGLVKLKSVVHSLTDSTPILNKTFGAVLCLEEKFNRLNQIDRVTECTREASESSFSC